MKRSLLLLLLTAVTCSSSLTSVPPQSKVVDLRWFDDAIAQANSLIVFEGLPHGVFERNDRLSEIARVATFEIGDQIFYLRELKITASDQKKLAELFVQERVVIPPPVKGLSMKLCGGFHADYAIRWEKDGAPLVTTLICFGCHELRIVQESTTVTADITKEAYESLRQLLTPYRQERPPFGRYEKAKKAGLLPPKPEIPKVEYKP